MTENHVVLRKGFTGELWRSIEGVYAEILAHPFLTGLTDGTLAEERFRFYVLQDALYLREYARALSLAGVRSPDESALVMFNEHSAGAIIVERSLHEGFLKDLGIAREEAEADVAVPHHPRLYELPAQNGHSGRLSRGVGSGVALLLDLLGSWQGPARQRLPQPPLPEVDRHLRRRGVRRARRGRTRPHR